MKGNFAYENVEEILKNVGNGGEKMENTSKILLEESSAL